MPRGQKRGKSRRDATCTACRGTRQLQFPQQAGVEAVVAGLGGEEVGLGKELVSAGALFARCCTGESDKVLGGLSCSPESF